MLFVSSKTSSLSTCRHCRIFNSFSTSVQLFFCKLKQSTQGRICRGLSAFLSFTNSDGCLARDDQLVREVILSSFFSVLRRFEDQTSVRSKTPRIGRMVLEYTSTMLAPALARIRTVRTGSIVTIAPNLLEEASRQTSQSSLEEGDRPASLDECTSFSAIIQSVALTKMQWTYAIPM